MNNKIIAGITLVAVGVTFGYLIKRSNDELNEAVTVYRESLDSRYSEVQRHASYDPHSLTSSIELMLKLSNPAKWGINLTKYQISLIVSRERTIVTEYILSKYDFNNYHKTT